MKVILFMATSVNGIIATKEGSEDFLSHTNWVQFVALTKQVGCLIWGRKTYDAVRTWDEAYLNDLKMVQKIIISRSNMSLKEGFTLSHSPQEALQLLESQGRKEVIVTGGSTINSEFAKAGLINEVILEVNPSLLGEGIPLFQPNNFVLSLNLIEAKKINDDIVEFHYTVKKF